MKKAAITFSVFLFAIVVPFLEINATHVFNPDWTPHMRIHEVWQLITNTSIGVLCLWLAWVKNNTKLSSILCLLVTGGFLLAFTIKNLYGGSMQFLDGSEKTLLGVNVGVIGFGLAVLFIIVANIFNRKTTKH